LECSVEVVAFEVYGVEGLLGLDVSVIFVGVGVAVLAGCVEDAAFVV
jgi:hypothetical protein